LLTVLVRQGDHGRRHHKATDVQASGRNRSGRSNPFRLKFPSIFPKASNALDGVKFLGLPACVGMRLRALCLTVAVDTSTALAAVELRLPAHPPIAHVGPAIEDTRHVVAAEHGLSQCSHTHKKKTAHEERKRETAVRRDRASVGEWRSTRVVVARFPVSPHPPTPRRVLCMGRDPPANLKQYPLFLCSGTDKTKAAPPVRSVMRSRQNQGSTPRSFCVPVPLHWCCSPPRACTCQAAAQQRNNGGQVGVVWFTARMSTRTPPTRVDPTCTQDSVGGCQGPSQERPGGRIRPLS